MLDHVHKVMRSICKLHGVHIPHKMHRYNTSLQYVKSRPAQQSWLTRDVNFYYAIKILKELKPLLENVENETFSVSSRVNNEIGSIRTVYISMLHKEIH